MKNQRKGKGFLKLILCLVACLLFSLPLGRIFANDGGMYEVKASAASGDYIEIQKLDVEMNVLASRKVEVEEKVTVKFLRYGLSMFYHSLPTEGCIYSDITASCPENPDFYYEVDDNPDISGFIDINCIGGADKGNTWTYVLKYTMQPNVFKADSMAVDIVGYGSSVEIHDVTATIHFPEAVTSQKVFVGRGEVDDYTLSADKKTITIQRDVLEMSYDNPYDEYMAKGITVSFDLPEGTLVGYGKSRMFTENMGKLLILAGICIAFATVIFALRKKREIITTVHVKPPEGMDPLQMGKILDGNADNEDVTSMIYYFAHKGYLKINLEDEEDPELIRLVPALPEDAPAYEHTLFKGLFNPNEADNGRVKVSALATRFYGASEKAKKQVLAPKPMYEGKSIFTFLVGGIIGLIYAFTATLLISRKVGGGYSSPIGAALAIPVVINWVIAAISENYRYKYKAGKRLALWLVQLGVSVLFGLVFTFFFAEHYMTEWEKLVVAIGTLLPAALTIPTMVRTEKYVETLGNILGFKEFITVTEEEKIAFMLAENPELYYEVLPYAQVLGVTDEWEKKFENLTVAPPTWYEGDLTVFDYILINRCVQRSMMRGLAEAAAKSNGGGHIGRSGGGGSFGGFGGGGFGGGGFGAR